MDLQRFGEKRVVPETLGSPHVSQRGLVPAHAVGVRNSQNSSPYTDTAHCSTCTFFKGYRLDIFDGDISENHRFSIELDVEVQMSPQSHLVSARGKKKGSYQLQIDPLSPELCN